MTRLALILFAVLLALPAAGLRADGLQSSQDDLRRIQEALSAKKREKEKTSRRARELSVEVEQTSRELRRARAAAAKIDRRLDDTEKQRRSLEDRVGLSRAGLERWEDRLAADMSVYFQGSVAAAEGIFAPMVMRGALLADRAAGLRFALRHHEEVVETRDEVLRLEETLRNLRVDKGREEDRISAARRRMQNLQRTTEGRRAVLEQEIDELNASAKRFERMVQRLIAEQRTASEKAARAAGSGPSFPVAAGRPAHKVPWPVRGVLAARFGRFKHPELDTYVFSNGLTIRPAAAAEVKAVDGGEVLYAGPFMNYGLMALVGHPGGWHSIYAGLGELSVARGQVVKAGGVVGRAGRNDDGQPAAYFELRIGGEAVDPLPWLK